MAQAQANGFGGGQEGESPAMGGGGKPDTPPSAGGKPAESGAGKSDVPPIKPLEAEPVTPEQPDNAKDRPAPPRTDKQEPSPFRKKKGEAITAEDIGNIVAKAVEATIRAHERITMPPKAGSNANDSVDLYVSQGLDTPGRPEITDPKIRASYGEDEEEYEDELPPNSPQRRASVKQSGGTAPYVPPLLDPDAPERDLMREEKKQGAGDFTNQGNVGIPQVDGAGRIIQPHTPEEFPAVGLNDYVNELEGTPTIFPSATI